MKRTAIAVGKIFTDGKGNYREVLAMGPEYKLYESQENADCLQYRLVCKARSSDIVWARINSTVISFAGWAKRESSLEDIFAIATEADEKKGRKYLGVVIGMSQAGRIFQYVGSPKFLASHRVDVFGAVPAIGELVTIRYGDGKRATFDVVTA